MIYRFKKIFFQATPVLDEICPFVFFKEAVRLVLLYLCRRRAPLSSASVSMVKRILASVGDSILEDNLELRHIRVGSYTGDFLVHGVCGKKDFL